MTGTRRRRRTLRAALLGGLAAVLLGAVAAVAPAFRSWSDGSGHGPWHVVFTGGGPMRGMQIGDRAGVRVAPRKATRPSVTHAALVVTKASYPDMVAHVRLHTDEQLRTGRPNPWEVGWVLWHYKSPQSFYAVVLKPNGWEISKQDPAYRGGQRFLASGQSPRFAIGSWHTVGIAQSGNRIIVSADGRRLAVVEDGDHPYLAGSIGLYAEDAKVDFVLVDVAALPPVNPVPPPRDGNAHSFGLGPQAQLFGGRPVANPAMTAPAPPPDDLSPILAPSQ